MAPPTADESSHLKQLPGATTGRAALSGGRGSVRALDGTPERVKLRKSNVTDLTPVRFEGRQISYAEYYQKKTGYKCNCTLPVYIDERGRLFSIEELFI
ncbi:hypothetical protein PRIPAC_88660 [Pristionchus pacificus]|uniref:Uncharacterized protein n=1 Tax=Pristionchus pacificus TaxID=54126 RepID=A0A2A6B5U4_PRIPA|nr:hypothetical protein PRIPAC_88660 [Pristionchus pacificus]|eukprot:PDM61250.1 hypothetical protein PRIPAC_50692 [Pristionchus pacificus]